MTRTLEVGDEVRLTGYAWAKYDLGDKVVKVRRLDQDGDGVFGPDAVEYVCRLDGNVYEDENTGMGFDWEYVDTDPGLAAGQYRVVLKKYNPVDGTTERIGSTKGFDGMILTDAEIGGIIMNTIYKYEGHPDYDPRMLVLE